MGKESVNLLLLPLTVRSNLGHCASSCVGARRLRRVCGVGYKCVSDGDLIGRLLKEPVVSRITRKQVF